MEKALVRIAFDYGYLQKDYLEKYPEQTGFKVLTEDGFVLETTDNKIEDTKDTIVLCAEDIVTEKGLNNGFYTPIRLKVAEDNVPHFLLPKEQEDAVKEQIKNVDTDKFDVVVRTQHLTEFVILKSEQENSYFPTKNDIVPMEIENDDGTFTKLTGNTVCGYLDGKAMVCVETEDNKFKDNEKTIFHHESIATDDGLGGEFYNENGREVNVEITEKGKIYINIQPERDYFDMEY